MKKVKFPVLPGSIIPYTPVRGDRFGMEDGVVSIFGLALGIAVSAQSGSGVFIAGATGAIAATVSRIAGRYPDVVSESDGERVAAEERDAEIPKDPQGDVNNLIDSLQTSGLSVKRLDALRGNFEARSSCHTESGNCHLL